MSSASALEKTSVDQDSKTIHGEQPDEAYELEEKGKNGTGKEIKESEPPASAMGGLEFFFVIAGLYAATFLVALDQTIIAPAIPIISDHFSALQDVGWYGSAYFLTTTSLQPLFGRIYAFYNQKTVFLACMIIFEVGSLLCGVATSSKMFIVGRAIAGLGVAGAYIGALTIVATVVPVEKQPVYLGGFGAAYGAAGISGPLIGGAFTSKVSWRWCFYINLPIGGVVLAAILLLFHPPANRDSRTHWEKLRNVDWLGSILVLGSTTCILLICQDGGLTYAWGSSRIIGMIVGFVLMWTVFWILQYYMGENATIPIRLITDRTIGVAWMCNFCIGASYYTWAYFLPTYFQSIKGSSAIRSGVQCLPLIVCTISAIIFAGSIIPKVGYANPFILIGGVLASVGAGLLYTLHINSGSSHWIGYQVLGGLGAGLSLQIPILLVQTKLTGSKDLEVGTAVAIFGQTLGSCIFVSVTESIYQNKLLHNLSTVLPPNQVAQIIGAGVTGFRATASPSELATILHAVIKSINTAFIPPIALAAAWTIIALFLEWKPVKGQSAAIAA